MKLYNLYEDVILEEMSKVRLLTENIIDDIKTAMEGRYNVWIKYADKDGTTTDRYIQIHQLGTSRAGNTMISAFQIGGKTTNTKGYVKPVTDGWKQFLVNNIKSVRPTNMKYNKPISDLPSYVGPDFNPNNKNMSNITNVDFTKNI